MFKIYRARLLATVSGFCNSTDASTGMVFALALIPAMVTVGASVDLSRAIREKGELAAATDAAALSLGRQMKTKTVQELATIANNILAASNPAYALSGNPALNSDSSEACITGSTAMPTSIMQVAGFNSIALTSRACVKTGGTTYEIALSLDVTGSMDDGNKIGSLRTAAKNFIDSVLPSNGSQNGYVKVSIVPFSTGVRAFDPDTIAESGNTNEATRFRNITWMDNGGASSIHWENYPKVTGGTFNPANRFEMYANMNQRWSGCFEARPGTYALTDAAPSAATPNSLFVPLLAPDEGDSADSTYNNYLSDYGNSVCVNSNTDPYKVRDGQTPYFGDGQSKLCKYKPGTSTTTETIPGACVTTTETYMTTERQRVQVCTNGNGNGNGNGWGWGWGWGNNNNCSYQWQDVPVEATREVRTCEPNTTRTTTTNLTLSVSTSSSKGPNRSCPTQVVMPLSNSATSLKAKIDTLSAGGNTNIIEGMMWGWRTVSPNGPYSGTESYTKPNHKKIIVLMTDGTNTWSTDSDNVNVSDYSPFGFFWNNRLGSAGGTIGNVTRSNVRTYMDAKTVEACANAKAAGIEVYAVAFSHTSYPIDSTGRALLQACASDSSKYYLVTNGSQLNLAFQNIGNSLDGIRLSR